MAVWEFWLIVSGHPTSGAVLANFQPRMAPGSKNIFEGGSLGKITGYSKCVTNFLKIAIFFEITNVFKVKVVLT